MAVAGTARHPGSTERLMEYWAHGEGAAKIGWGVAGDFDRCVLHLSKYVPPGEVKGLCSNLHERATGARPGHAAGESHRSGVPVANKKPYGNVTYADPGYQKDGKARYPIDTAEHVRAAWSYINQADNAGQYSPENLSKIKASIKAAAKRLGVEISDGAQRMVAAGLDPDVARDFVMNRDPFVPAGVFMRSFPLEDIRISRSGDGRTVEAYAAVYNTEAEIRDHEGHYNEVIDPGAFDKALARARVGELWRVGVFYNHAMTMHGTPSERGSVPIGTPLDIRPDSRGLLTVTRYNHTPLAEEVLEAIRDGSINAQSFTGKIGRSTPSLSRRQRQLGGYQLGPDGRLQTVRRMELGLSEYGPTPAPAYHGAAVVGLRAALLGFADEDQDDVDVPDESVPDVTAVADVNPLHRRLQAAMRARGI